jgi:predicted transglutaminase-like cysteine proteinase
MAMATDSPTIVFADPINSPRVQQRTSANMRVFDAMPAPSGFVDFCRRMPEECGQIGVMANG